MLKVAALVAADGDRECPPSRQAAKLYILARYEHIVSPARHWDMSCSQKAIPTSTKVIIS